MSARKPLPDQAARDEARTSRGVNLVVDAGAGTGKTTLLVARLVEMVAPEKDAMDAIPLGEIAAVTFTRKAAGELRLRVREKLLSELTRKPSATRRDRLTAALAAADTAFIGTIHGFADRLLRRHPVEARLSPSYEILEDAGTLAHETFETLLLASEADRLDDELEGTDVSPEEAREAAEAIRAALRAELRVETAEYEFSSKHGLDALFRAFIEHRDVPPGETAAAPFPAGRVKDRIAGFLELARRSSGDGQGSRFLARLVRELAEVANDLEPAALLREATAVLRRVPYKMRKGTEFAGDPAGWEAWKAWGGYEKTVNKEKVEVPGIDPEVLGPAWRWLATRLVRAFPAVVAVYGKVKARHRAVDQVDLLLSLRDLLRDDLAVRGEMQGLFRHVFVDEFQDTDPLQAEVVLYLCEKAPVATRWEDVELAPGKLTLVGDPKQSIYRFRRADISVYEAVRSIVLKGNGRAVALTTNFRSRPALVAHLNGRYDEILGKPEPGKPDFDVDAGTVVNRPLDAGRDDPEKGCVAVLPFRSDDGRSLSDRTVEATVVATFLRTRHDAGMGYGDVAVLAHSTYYVHLLTAELDRLGVPWAARGGTLFLEDPLHKQFILGLRAIADRDDGVALAALLREPFFAVDLADLVREEAAGEDSKDEGLLRARAAIAQVTELRRRRFERPPGDTARDLLETTGFGRAVALGPNAQQRLDRIRELCFELERVAASGGLDYDGATALMREWVSEPEGLDPPRPVGRDAVQIMTIHQAKGLEFPVVVWWDARATLEPRKRQALWHVDRATGAWALEIDGLSWEEPAGSGVMDRENHYLGAERLRLVYVAGTRARDLLVLPTAGGGGPGCVTNALVGVESPALVVHGEWQPDAVPAWARGVKEPPVRRPKEAKALVAKVEKAWTAATVEAGKTRFEPRGISAEAHARLDAEDEAGERWKARDSRFGNVFGETVHLAIGLSLREPELAAADAVARIAKATGLDDHLPEAAEDVTRALAALEREGLRRAPGDDLRLEYPIASGEDGKLLLGYLDLLSAKEGNVVVVDFKTDAPPRGAVTEGYPAYVEQVREYGRILVKLGLAKAGAIRCGLLFTGDGGMRWV
ncbi:MAG: UvrD-helicase domain-containing protein [Anaeromyxobacteraceae bacterium]